MKQVLYALLLVPACIGHYAHVKKHFEKKVEKPDCHVEWEDIVTPQCKTSYEQVCVEEYKDQCKTEYSTSCETEYKTQCKTEYEELCETTDKKQCHTEHEQECHEEYNEQCSTEYTEQCTDLPREVCHDEPTQECSTEYSEVCGTEYEEVCHTEYTEQCKDVPECWVEQKEECHTVQVKVHQKSTPKYSKKWKRSLVDGEAVDSPVEEEEEDSEGEIVIDAGEEVDADGESRGTRGTKPWARSKKKSYGTKTETVCNHVPVKRCTSKQVCDQVSR